MSTPHINAKPEDFAKTVLMPGDPLRSKFIAETFLENPVLVNNVRGVQGYTGTYKGKKVSVMASGMGMPSMGIYSYELFNFFGVENIIRIGSAGAIHKDIPLRSIVIGMGACYNTVFADQFRLPGHFTPIASFDLLRKAVDTAEAMKVNYRVGNLRNFHDPVDIKGVTGPQHGSFMRITKKEYNKLLKFDAEYKKNKK